MQVEVVIRSPSARVAEFLVLSSLVCVKLRCRNCWMRWDGGTARKSKNPRIWIKYQWTVWNLVKEIGTWWTLNAVYVVPKKDFSKKGTKRRLLLHKNDDYRFILYCFKIGVRHFLDMEGLYGAGGGTIIGAMTGTKGRGMGRWWVRWDGTSTMEWYHEQYIGTMGLCDHFSTNDFCLTTLDHVVTKKLHPNLNIKRSWAIDCGVLWRKLAL